MTVSDNLLNLPSFFYPVQLDSVHSRTSFCTQLADKYLLFVDSLSRCVYFKFQNSQQKLHRRRGNSLKEQESGKLACSVFCFTL